MPKMKPFLKYLYRKPKHLLIRGISILKSSILDIGKMDKVLVLAPHPDDEVFGCASLMETLTKKGKRVEILFLSRGEAAVECNYDWARLVAERRKLAERANGLLGISVENIHWMDVPDGKFKELMKDYEWELGMRIKDLAPDTVFFPHHWDGSPDHEAATEVIGPLVKKLGVQGYEYCVWLWHHMAFKKAFMLDYANSYLLPVDSNGKKQEAIDLYANAVDENGVYYSGKLPKMFLSAVRWKYELFFKV